MPATNVIKNSKIFGVLFLIFCGILMINVLTILVGTGVAVYGDNLVKKFGESLMGDFSYELAVTIVGLSALIALMYLFAGLGLFGLKKWAYKSLFAIGLLALVVGLVQILAKNYFSGILDLIKIFPYLYFGNKVRNRTDVYVN